MLAVGGTVGLTVRDQSHGASAAAAASQFGRQAVRRGCRLCADEFERGVGYAEFRQVVVISIQKALQKVS